MTHLLALTALMMGFVPLEKIVAIVGEIPIMHSEVMELLQQAGYDLQGDFQTVSGSTDYLEALEELIKSRMIVAAATDAGFYPTQDEIEAMIDEEIAIDPELENMDREELGRILAESRAGQIMLGRKVQSAYQEMSMSPGNYLMSNSGIVEDVAMPRHLAWIYLPILPSGDDHDEAVSQLQELRERLVTGESSFSELAIAYSEEDNSAVNGGSLGRFAPEEMTYTFEEAILSLEVGEISEPVTTPFGVHLIKLDDSFEDGTYEASHILLTVPLDSIDMEITREHAEQIASDIQSGALTFRTAVDLYSRDPSTRPEGGDIGIRPVRLWIPDLEGTIEDMQPGECTDPMLLSDMSAFVIFGLVDDNTEMDWSTLSDEDLYGMYQQIIYQKSYDEIVDSLYSEIPVVYLLGDDAQIED